MEAENKLWLPEKAKASIERCRICYELVKSDEVVEIDYSSYGDFCSHVKKIAEPPVIEVASSEVVAEPQTGTIGELISSAHDLRKEYPPVKDALPIRLSDQPIPVSFRESMYGIGGVVLSVLPMLVMLYLLAIWS
jgi:hypothetical protein